MSPFNLDETSLKPFKKMTEMKETNVKIFSKEERIWEDVKASCETAMEEHEKGLYFNRHLLQFAIEKLIKIRKGEKQEKQELKADLKRKYGDG